MIVVHEILYAKGPVVTAHTYPYQPNGHGFKGAIPKVTRLPVWWELTQLFALHRTTPDRNTELRPVPSIYIIQFLQADSIALTRPRARHLTLRKLL